MFASLRDTYLKSKSFIFLHLFSPCLNSKFTPEFWVVRIGPSNHLSLEEITVIASHKVLEEIDVKISLTDGNPCGIFD